MKEATRTARLSRCHTYATDRLGIKLHPAQVGVLRDLFARRGTRVAFRCGNEVGKTTHVAAPAILYALEILNAQVISTAGVWMQVVDQLVPALKRFSHLYPDWRFLEHTISIKGIDRYVGFSTRDEGFAQGFHRKEGMPLVAVIDEAAAVKSVVFQGIEDRCNPDHLLIMGSPLDPEGAFYDIETKLAKFYTHHHLSQRDCLTTAGYWIDPLTIERKEMKYGGREHPFVKSNVDGEFASRVVNGLMSLAEFENCVRAEKEFQPGHNDRHLFIDVGVTNLAACRHGNKIWIENKFMVPDISGIPTICGHIMRMAAELKRRINLQPGEITVDGSGDWGKKVCDALAAADFPVNRFYGGQASSDPDYNDKNAEAWIGGAGAIRDCDIIIPNNDNFRTQCLTRKQFTGARGKLVLEAKETYMERMKCESPHEGDAIFGAMMRSALAGSISLIDAPNERVGRGWIEQAREEGGGGQVLEAEAWL